jgi:hypothetical protein
VIEELVLHLGHVDVGRTLGLAALALQAQVHHLVEPLAGELGRRHPAGEHRAEGVGPAARGVFFIAGGHVAGAHGALQLLAAGAHAVAHLDRRRKAALGREIEQGDGLPRLVADAVAEVFQDAGRIHDVARVHPAVGVERLLQTAEGLHERGAVHPLQERAAGAPVAVLAGNGAAVLQHQVGDLVGDCPYLLHAARDLEVDHGADVQAADRAMAVVGADRVVLGEDLFELGNELREVPRLHAGVFHESDRLLVALHAEQQAEPRLA